MQDSTGSIQEGRSQMSIISHVDQLQAFYYCEHFPSCEPLFPHNRQLHPKHQIVKRDPRLDQLHLAPLLRLGLKEQMLALVQHWPS
ncbi:hypothetical protein FGO68_gene3606 [Halteria grandinella]|uniref:Uncharacterized protein n=1 Tax=Halteria grandinella TaxID=5974 RepID=A0A8J8SU07_HALGN|nr:hypothetical protein FGO68_gene3606 [Halteria grandinella]